MLFSLQKDPKANKNEIYFEKTKRQRDRQVDGRMKGQIIRLTKD